MNSKKLICLVAIVAQGCRTDDSFKEYIIDHENDIVKTDSNHFELRCDLASFDKATITLQEDSSYYFTFWRKKESLLSDKHVDVCTSFRRYKGENVKNDVIIYRSLKQK